MNHSHPNRWIYGGILERCEWHTEPCELRRWDGRCETVQPGDTLLLLRSAYRCVVVGREAA